MSKHSALMNKSKKCNTCMYRASSEVPWGCDYMIITGKMKWCDPGDNCTKYKKGKRPKLNNNIYIYNDYD